ncbi:MAG: hypothetical protein PHG66_03440 [Candidatus Colwellbacteria bacterium]|nr:hypothetical protein [Candidatus Colwellbacteria bacterium]
MDNIVEEIKKIKGIVPDAAFSSLSRSVILSSPRIEATKNTRRPFIFEFGLSFGVMAVAVMIAVLVRDTGTPGTMITVASLNDIENEATTANNDIDITLGDIRSFDEANGRMAVALNEVSSNSPAHINASVLSEEINNLNIEAQPSTNVDVLLDQAIF